MSDSLLLWALAVAVSAAIVTLYTVSFRRRVASARERKLEASDLGIDQPTAQYPFIDATKCIGCGACVEACPEGDPLGVVAGTAVVINGLRCVGHGHCELACPVGAIEVGLGDLKGRQDIPLLDESHETSTPGLYIAGELGGLALVRNACRQGREAAEAIVRSLTLERSSGPRSSEELDLAIVGAGPAGLAAALAAADRGAALRRARARGEPRWQPSALPATQDGPDATGGAGLLGRLDRTEYSKEDLLDLFARMVEEVGLRVEFQRSWRASPRTASFSS